MLFEAWSYFLYLSSLLYHAIVPCTFPEQLLANKVDRQQFLGKWYFKAAVSHREADIHKFSVFDNMLFIMEETANDTLKLSGHLRMGDDCMKQTWTYHLQPGREDLVLEGRPQRRTLLWSGSWANCLDCIILQEIEPPETETDSEDSLSRFMLYARQKHVNSEVVTTFLKRTACNKMGKSVTLPQEREFCA
ncbi:apolipoprotein M [Melanotaenia boesemani]|uniref:apolipoprotein M n=1 Tax=Melanotaenia boesemani TaxID=1250792 RepID=UPI001C056811|nr:apolipoprotein M [Melanotaenia boesemani]